MVRYAAADLETDALGPRLEEAGLDPAEPAFVACLGVLIYLRGRTDGLLQPSRVVIADVVV